MKSKRKQYQINQFQLRDLEKCSKENVFKIIELEDHKPVQQSENFLFHMTYKITKSTPVDNQPNELNEIFTIKTGTGSTTDEKDKLSKVLDEGVMYRGCKYLFLDVSLSGSQHKTCKQYYVLEGIYEKLKEVLTLGKQPNMTVPSKYLTAVALMTTSCNLFNIKDYIDQLNICVIEDLEYDLENKAIVYNEACGHKGQVNCPLCVLV